MKIKFLFLLALNFAATNQIIGQEPDWFLKLKEAKIIQSTRQDVERIFGNPQIVYSTKNDSREKGWGEINRYETKDGKLEIYYSTGKCSEVTGNRGWDIDKDLIVSIEFQPTKPVKLSELNLDLTIFKREKGYDSESWSYQSEQLGIDMGVLEGKVTGIEFSLTPEMRKLDCEIVLKK